MGNDDKRDSCQHGHRLEVFQRFKEHLWVQTHVGRQPTRRPQADGVTVRKCLGHQSEANIATSPGPIVNNHLLAQFFVQAKREHAHDNLGAPARRKGHREADGLVGLVRLAKCYWNDQQKRQQAKPCRNEVMQHSCLHLFLNLIKTNFNSFVK